MSIQLKQGDLRKIYEYIAYDLLVSATATAQTQRIMEEIRTLDNMSMSIIRNIDNAGYTEPAIDSDYANARLMDKWGIQLGQLIIYDISTTKVRAIPTTKILWAYTDLKSYQTKYGSELPVNTLVPHVEGRSKRILYGLLRENKHNPNAATNK